MLEAFNIHTHIFPLLEGECLLHTSLILELKCKAGSFDEGHFLGLILEHHTPLRIAIQTVQTPWLKRWQGVTTCWVCFCAHYLTHWLLCRPQPTMTILNLSSTSDVITFWSAGIGIIYTQLLQEGKTVPGNDTQIRAIGLMEPEICTKMLKKSGEKLRAKFPALHMAHGKKCLSQWRFLGSFLTASKPSRRSVTAAKGKGTEKK